MRLRLIVIAILVFNLLCISASAHPGRTDSDGGHTDHSTGDYHYHHGYGAHDHYDMDGDGDLDCPYDFVEKEDHESKKSQSTKKTKAAQVQDFDDNDYKKENVWWKEPLTILVILVLIYGTPIVLPYIIIGIKKIFSWFK